MPLPFPHSCTITRPGEDTRPLDPEFGQPIGPEPRPVTVYAGRCYLDERGEAVRRQKGGDVNLAGQGVLRLPADAGVFDEETDTVTVTANGARRRARITRTSYLRHRTELLLAYDTRAEAAP